ncbi:MAG TPA: hypothetical protein VFF50_04070 [Candidatus Deferrimicrobiaceae bacterium]|nr:hypothetical protein [Candidatus Deferrimicrobiaceae bacterium]
MYYDSNSVSHGFIRFPNGTLTEFDVPGAGTASGQGTLPEVFNLLGEVSGPYYDSNSVAHAFIRSPNSSITTFDAPGAGSGSGQGTTPTGLNTEGDISGYLRGHE